MTDDVLSVEEALREAEEFLSLYLCEDVGLSDEIPSCQHEGCAVWSKVASTRRALGEESRP